MRNRRGGIIGRGECGELAAAKDPPVELEAMWRGLKTPAILVPPPVGPAAHMAAVGVPHMYRPRLDYWSLPSWTYAADNTPLKETLERLDWDQVRDPDHMRVFVSASDIENGKTVYFSNLYPKKELPGPEYPAVHFGVEHVLASGSFPGGFPWTVIDGRSYWDGGVTDNTPLHPVIDNLTAAEAQTMPIYVINVNTGAGYIPANLLQVVLREFEMLLQNNLATDTHRAARYVQFISLLKEVNTILEHKEATRILEEVRKLSSAPSGLADLLAELLELKGTEDWGEAMTYDPVRNVHAVDIMKPAGESPGDFTGEAIERRLDYGYRQMRGYLDSLPPTTSG
jgi:NTE family protein